MQTKVDIISGFLGAGKTTFIKKLLDEKFYTEKLAIIENEFGEVGIDGSLLKSSNIEVKEINAGCICCTLSGDFEKALKEVVSKYAPQRIIIEPSGVGKLSEILQACEAPGLSELLTLNMVITIVDALKYQLYQSNFGEFFNNQIQNAKTIVISRSQKVDEKKIEGIVHSIKEKNHLANIITTPWDKLDAELIVAVAQRDHAISLESQLSEIQNIHNDDCHCGCKSQHNHLQKHNEAFEYWSVETPKRFEVSQLKCVLNNLTNNTSYGVILRGKGLLQTIEGGWIQFDYTPGEFDIKSLDVSYTGRICIIGTGLKKDELCTMFGISN